MLTEVAKDSRMPIVKRRAGYFICLLLLLAVVFPALHIEAQSNEETMRDVCRAKLIEARKAHKRSHTSQNSKIAPTKSAANELNNRLLGLTLWRMVPGDRSLNHPVQIEKFIPESISLDTPLRNGDKVRISIELPREGYIYVIDSEQYQDGEKSASLIFPTKRLNGGNNKIGPGIAIGLPALNDTPPYFELEIKEHQITENLRILVTDEPIPNLVIGNNPIKLSNEQFTEWCKWEVNTKQISLEQTGRTQSEVEHQAEIVGNETRELKHTDPLPQCVMLADIKPGQAWMMNVSLKLTQK